MRKLSFAAVVVLVLGGAGLATTASAVPGSPMGVTAADTVTTVRHRGGARRHAFAARKKARAYRLNSYKKARSYRLNSYKKARAYRLNSYKKYNRRRYYY